MQAKKYAYTNTYYSTDWTTEQPANIKTIDPTKLPTVASAITPT